jgi:hypothetical protein
MTFAFVIYQLIFEEFWLEETHSQPNSPVKYYTSVCRYISLKFEL